MSFIGGLKHELYVTIGGMGRKTLTRTTMLAQQLAERKLRQQQEQMGFLRLLPHLQAVPEEELKYLPDLCTLRAFAPGQILMSEDQESEYLYLLLQGTASLTLQEQQRMVGPGSCCGIENLFDPELPRRRLVAKTHCYVLQLTGSNVKMLLLALPQLSAALQHSSQPAEEP